MSRQDDPSAEARALWNLVNTQEWRPGEFRSRFERLYAETCDLETLWQLGGALNDYLRRHPNALPVPWELPRTLLASPHVEARIIGLKLLNRANVTETEIVHAIIAALRAPAEYGEYSGLFETGNFIVRCRDAGTRLPDDIVRDLVRALREYVADKDANDQRVANRHIEELVELGMSRRALMRVELAAAWPNRWPGVRAFASEDVGALGDLMYRAYVGTVDYDGETPEQAAAEIAKTVAGEYGEFLAACSRVAERSGRVVSATLITRFQDKPLVAFTFTDPAFARQGLARQCLHAAMAELFAQGERELRLVVTVANSPAVRLYKALGFQFEVA